MAQFEKAIGMHLTFFIEFSWCNLNTTRMLFNILSEILIINYKVSHILMVTCVNFLIYCIENSFKKEKWSPVRIKGLYPVQFLLYWLILFNKHLSKKQKACILFKRNRTQINIQYMNRNLKLKIVLVCNYLEQYNTKLSNKNTVPLI